MSKKQAETKKQEKQPAAAPTPKAEADTPQDEWRDKALRLAADMENLRKRTAREMRDAHQFAITSFARELLAVADNMERALAAIDQQAENPEPLKEGVSLVAHQLEQVFGKFQIQKFVSKGQSLNPEKHQVMTQVTSEQPAGTVVEEMQPGYMIGDRLLRPALVAVAQEQEKEGTDKDKELKK
jgi:molecular chaperone GrpE